MAGRAKNKLPFNSQAVAKAGAIGGKLTEYKIEGVPGLTLVVQPTGFATYFVRYQAKHGRVRRFMRESLGRRDESEVGYVSLHDARKRCLAIMAEVSAGKDPTGDAKKLKNAITFDELFADRLRADQGRSARTLNDYKAALELDQIISTKEGGAGSLGPLPADSITADQIAKVLKKIEKRSKHAAHKARAAIGSTYRWGYKRREVKSNPTLGLGFTVQSTPRNRVFDADEIAQVWTAINSGPGLTQAMRILLKLAILTGQRESEVAGALVSELKLNAANATWRIPSERMKRKNREQIVPLSKQAVALFKQAIELAGKSEYVFPADASRSGAEATRVPHVHGESVSRAMARLRERVGLEDARVHDFRKTVTTWLRENGTSSDICDLILHHARKGVTSTHYDFATLEGPVRAALQKWADYVDRIVAAQPESNIASLARRG